MTIIPAIDIINGECVRLTQGNYAQQTVYNANPVEVAKQFVDAGFERLHIVDLDGARTGKPVNIKLLEQIASATGAIIDFGGGIKTRDNVQTVLDAGASIITIGSLAVNAPALVETWIKELGSDCFLIGADVLDEKVRISGWQEETGIDLEDLIEDMLNRGALNFFCTDISKDGMMNGPAIELYKKIIDKFPAVSLVASGGVSHIDDVVKLRDTGCSGVIIGKAIYEQLISLKELSVFNA